MIIYQGNTYNLPIALKIGDKAVTDKDVKKVEFMFGDVKKVYPGEATFNSDNFIVPLTQEETFSFLPQVIYKYHARILFNDGSVKGTDPVEFTVIESNSKEVLV